MKLLRFGPPGYERPGALDKNGQIRDISSACADLSGSALSRDNLNKLKALDLENLPLAPQDVRLGPCVGAVRNFIAVGLNYADHAKESNAPIPSEPILFNKAPSCIAGPNDDVIIPHGSTKSDWEVELAIVIGNGGSYITKENALDHVAGFCICNDVSEREFQLERGGNWCKGKSAPTFGPIGPWLVTADEITNVGQLDIWLDLNGERMQKGSTGTMIFDVPYLISYISRFMLLEAGDLITTGTPPGVGMGKNPPRYLKQGDIMELGIQGLGTQRQAVVNLS